MTLESLDGVSITDTSIGPGTVATGYAGVDFNTSRNKQKAVLDIHK